MPSATFTVSGNVQGVFFRASTRSEALRLGICGYARNCADGSVEVVAHGEAEALDALARWLLRGPRTARVDEVLRRERDPAGALVEAFDVL